jgi:aminoglycoside 6'-N-acetyltransferase I
MLISGEHLMPIRVAEPKDWKALAQMRALLWPESSYEEHLAELEAGPAAFCQPDFPMERLVAEDESGALTGFLEVGLRSHADGCDTRQPVGYVEGWFVHEEHREKGIGAALLRAAEDWARAHSCVEMASDALIDNALSQTAHTALGFEITDRCVLFRKKL